MRERTAVQCIRCRMPRAVRKAFHAPPTRVLGRSDSLQCAALFSDHGSSAASVKAERGEKNNAEPRCTSAQITLHSQAASKALATNCVAFVIWLKEKQRAAGRVESL